MQKILKDAEKTCKKLKNNQNYSDFIEFLKSLSKNETVEDVERHRKIINSKQNIIGISMKNIRLISNIISKHSQVEFLKIMKNKKAQDCFYEETLIEGLVIAQIEDLNLLVEKLETWVHKIDNWSTCDSVVVSLKNLKQSKDKNLYFQNFKQMCFSEFEFIARFGIIVCMYCYLEQEYIDEIFEIIKSINNRAYYVKMAIAWLISYAYLFDKQKTYNLLQMKILDKFVQNKSISKCRESFRILQEDKEKLKMLKI